MPTPTTFLPFAATCKALDDPSDRALLLQVRDGNEEAAERLYRRYAHRLLALSQKQLGPDLANRFDPEDVVQSVFGSFFRRAGEGLYEIPEGEDLWPLLLVIALNKVRASGIYHRAARRNVRREVPRDDSDSVTRAIEQMETTDSQPYIRLVVEETIDQLPPHYQQVVRWRLEGYSHNEIAALSGRSKRSIERIFQEIRLIFQQ